MFMSGVFFKKSILFMLSKIFLVARSLFAGCAKMPTHTHTTALTLIVQHGKVNLMNGQTHTQQNFMPHS